MKGSVRGKVVCKEGSKKMRVQGRVSKESYARNSVWERGSSGRGRGLGGAWQGECV